MSVCLLWLGLLHISLSALWQAANIQAAVTIDEVTLTVLPADNVESGTKVTLRCEASVSQSHRQRLTHSFSLMQDNQVIYSKNTSGSWMERSLSPARVSNSGRYQCSVHINNKHKKSNTLSLRVTGLQIPMLKVKSDIVFEGREVIATCSAPEETGSLMFFFYENDQEVRTTPSNINSVTITLTQQKLKDIYLHCDYMVLMQQTEGHSNKSNMVKITLQAVTIDEVTLTVLPADNVESGTKVTLRCEASVSQSHRQRLTHSFSLMQDDQVIYSKNTSGSWMERSLSPARVSNSGRYQCSVHINNKHKKSNTLSLRVTGLQIPMLKVKSDIVFEGGDVIATCSAPEETGSLMFFFYENDQEVRKTPSNINSVTITLTMQKLKDIYLHCDYMVLMQQKEGHSNKSNMVKITVQDLDVITPQISISPNVNVVEGDRVQITCNVQLNSDIELYLTKDYTVLRVSRTNFTHSFVVRAEDSGDYVCKAEKGSVQKMAFYRLNVTELFSKPILRMIPDQVFEGERFTLNCSSDVISPAKIRKADIREERRGKQRI